MTISIKIQVFRARAHVQAVRDALSRSRTLTHVAGAGVRVVSFIPDIILDVGGRVEAERLN